MNGVGSRIKWIRNYLKETQDRFAGRMNVTKTTLISYEQNKTDPGTIQLRNLYNSAKELNINLNWLINGEGEPFTEKEDRELEIELKLRKRIDELQQELLDNFRNNRKD